jgi:DNA modification methylase
MRDAQILQGDCIETMRGLPAGIVQTCVTSPPYYGLRDYGHEGQIGLEETPDAYVAKLVEVFREVKRLLRDDGTLWLNLGDSYNGSGGAGGDYGVGGLKEGQPKYPGRNIAALKPKDLIGIPWSVAFALRADGWYLRSDIIWHKPNPMPESVTDRPTKAHEYIFLLSKSRDYYYDSDAIKEQSVDPQGSAKRYEAAFFVGPKHEAGGYSPNGAKHTAGIKEFDGTRNKRSVWTVTTKPYAEAHFATFPPDLIEPCILAGTSAHGCCAKCGAVWERVTDITRGGPSTIDERQKAAGGVMRLAPHMPDHSRSISPTGKTPGSDTRGFPTVEIKTTGWQPTCTCNADVVPCTVLDPFNGSGTTGAVSLKHGRKYIGCELNPDYIELSYRRIARSQPMLMEVSNA